MWVRSVTSGISVSAESLGLVDDFADAVDSATRASVPDPTPSLVKVYLPDRLVLHGCKELLGESVGPGPEGYFLAGSYGAVSGGSIKMSICQRRSLPRPTSLCLEQLSRV